MQRLARLTQQDSHTEAVALFSQYDRLRTILLRHLPPSTAALFARPIEKDGYVEWWTDVEGQPVPLVEDAANQEQVKQINRIIDERLLSVTDLVAELQAKQAIDTKDADLLQRLVKATTHNTKQIYLVNHSPIIVGWGMGKEPEPPVIPPPPVTATSRPWYWWLLPLLLLLLALLAYWWFCLRTPEVKPEPPKTEQKVEPVKKEEPKPEPIKETPPKEEPPKEEPVKETPVTEVKEEVKPQKVCRQNIIPGEAPQMVLILNNAAGMQYTIKEPPEKLATFDERWGKGKVTDKDINYMFRKPNRSEAMKTATNDLVQFIDPNIDIGLVELKSCLTEKDRNSAKSYGIFAAAQRDALKTQIRSLKIRRHRVPGIPMYEGLQRALNMVDGKERDALIVFITDGNGDCTNRKACNLLKKELESRPKLKVNVVLVNSIWEDKNTLCLAESSGGQVFNSVVSSEKELNKLISDATKPMQTEEVCE